MRLLLLVCFAGLVVAHDSNLDSTWNLFKQKHGKVYTGIQEATRRAVWEKAIRYIQQHNLEADLGLHTYWVGLNEYSDLTDEEYRNYLTGYRGNSTRKSSSQFMAPSHVTFPDEVDWRQEGYVTEVKNQKHCGSCWAFSTTGSLEGQHFKKTGKLVSLSEQNLVDCSKRNLGCNGGFVDVALRYIYDNGGIDTEESYPYEARDGQCRFKKEDVGATDVGVVNILKGSETSLKQAVATVGPVSVAIDASHKSFQYYRSGVYNEPLCSSIHLDHAVLVVGYGTEGDDDYWLVKNSWGDTWGNGGYIKMSRGRNNQCGIASSASYPLV